MVSETLLPFNLTTLTADALLRAGWRLLIGLGTVEGSLIVVTTVRGRIALDNWRDLGDGLDCALSAAAGGCGWLVFKRECASYVN